MKNYPKKSHEERQAEIEALVKQAQEGVDSFRNSEEFITYLKVMSAFHHYSVCNLALIAHQNPNATKVGSFVAWKSVNRAVNAGEHGIKILCPTMRKATHDITAVNENTGEEEVIGSETTSVVRGFKIGHVFDISQTHVIEGKEEVETSLCHELTGSVDDFDKIVSVMSDIAGIPVVFTEYDGSSKGYYSPAENRIVVQSEMSQAQKIKTLIHEVAHSILHNPVAKLDRGDISKEVMETEAEATAFVVASHLGIDTSSYSFPYLVSWADTERNSVMKSLNSIKCAASQMIDKLDEAFA